VRYLTGDSPIIANHSYVKRMLLICTQLFSQKNWMSLSRDKNSVLVFPTNDGRVVCITCIPTTCCGEIFEVRNVQIAHVTLTTPIREHSLITRLRLRMADPCKLTKSDVSRFTRYEAMNGGAKCRKWGGLGRLGGTQGHRHHSIKRIRLPIRL